MTYTEFGAWYDGEKKLASYGVYHEDFHAVKVQIISDPKKHGFTSQMLDCLLEDGVIDHKDVLDAEAKLNE